MFSITGIIALITGLAGPISTALADLSNLQIAKVQATTAEDQANVNGQIAEAQDRMMVLQAEAGSRINATVRFLLALGPMIYLDKVFIFDKVIGSFLGHANGGSAFSTDPLDSNLWLVATAVMSFYFVYDIAASWRK